jgi:putative PEP-CTERM system TPR-repeat lipoprotein
MGFLRNAVFCNNNGGDMIKGVKKTRLAIVTSMLAISIMGGLSACHKTETPEALITDAKNYHDKGDNKAAIIQLKNALSQTPDNAEARLLLGTVYSESGDPLSAEKEVRKAMSLGLAPDRAVTELGKILLAQGRYQDLLNETQADNLKNSPDILTLRGDAQLALGHMDDAKASFDAALKIKDGFANALLGQARYAAIQHDMDEAARLVEVAIAKNPRDAEVWTFKGDLMRSMRKNESAIAAYNQAISLNPNQFAAHIERAYIEIGTSKFDAAKDDVDAARKIIPSSLTVLYVQALSDFTQNKNSAALESLQKILRAAPEHMPSILLTGAVEYRTGATKDAEQNLKKYVEKNPDNVYARKLLTSAMIKNGESKEAIGVLTPALKEAPDDAQLFALAGESYMHVRDFGKATEFFEKASGLAPNVGILHTSIGLSKLGQGDSASAVTEMELGANMDTKSPKAAISLVLTDLRLKHYEKALAAAQALEKSQPDNPLVENLIGGVYVAKGDATTGRTYFEKALKLKSDFFPSLINLAQLDVVDKKPDVAKQRLLAYLEKDKKSTPAMDALSRLADSQGQQEEGTTWLEKASNENPDAVRPALQLAARYMMTDQKNRALTLLHKLQAANSSNVEVLDLLAQAQLGTGDQAGALETYSKLINLAPNSARAEFQLAQVHFQMKNDDAAQEDLKHALAKQPDFEPAMIAQAQLDVRKGNADHALTIAHEMEKKHADSPDGFMLEGDILDIQGKSAPALATYEHAFTLGKTTPLMYKIYLLLKKTGKTAEADTRIAQWQKDHPGDTQLTMYLAQTSLADKQYATAIGQLETVVKQSPKNVIALNDLAWAYDQQKDARAQDIAEQAYKLGGDNPTVMDTLGWILIEKGDTQRGLSLLKKAISLAPTSTEIRYHYASGLIKSGDKTSAKEELQQLFTLSKSFPEEAQARELLKQL